MGKVWVGYHHRLKTRVAVKFVHEKITGDNPGEAIKRFEHEASTASQIKSPHVVQIFDSGVTAEGEPYIVMELLEGQSLGERIRTSGPLSWNEAATVIAQVARALTKAHEIGIVHRDIKPDNIFLCRSDEGLHCKILDFGIAKQTRLPAMGGLTTDGKIVGTPEFMSPELVLEDRMVDYRADLWALGVVMYSAITSQLPFTGKTLGQLCLNLVNKRPVAPSQIRADLPPGADSWFAKALHRQSEQRYASAREMAVTFAAVLGGVTVSALASPTLTLDLDTQRQFAAAADPPTRQIRRRAISMRAVLAIASVAAVAAAVAVLVRSDERARTAQSSAADRAVEAASGLTSPPASSASGSAPAAHATASAKPAPAGSPAAAASPASVARAASATASAPANDPKPAGKMRGEKELGF
jgi:serine/threonine-protein kinase